MGKINRHKYKITDSDCELIQTDILLVGALLMLSKTPQPQECKDKLFNKIGNYLVSRGILTKVE